MDGWMDVQLFGTTEIITLSFHIHMYSHIMPFVHVNINMSKFTCRISGEIFFLPCWFFFLVFLLSFFHLSFFFLPWFIFSEVPGRVLLNKEFNSLVSKLTIKRRLPGSGLKRRVAVSKSPPKHLALFPILGSGVETPTCLFLDRALLAVPLLIGWFCSLFIKFLRSCFSIS